MQIRLQVNGWGLEDVPIPQADGAIIEWKALTFVEHPALPQVQVMIHPEGWEKFLEALNDPDAAKEKAEARSKIVVPGGPLPQPAAPVS